MIKKSGELGRLRWSCRRGMLELDMVLLPFLDHHYETLTPEQKKVFERLLEEQDTVLQSWFTRQLIPEDQEISAMVKFIFSRK